MSAQPRPRNACLGFSLVEVLIATAIFVVGAGVLAHLVLLSMRTNLGARVTTFVATLGEQKIEELQGSPEGPSPFGSLAQNMAGYCDFLDGAGHAVDTEVCGGSTVPDGVAYIRRWAVEPIPDDQASVVVQVLVMTKRNRGYADQAVDVRRLPEEARFVGLAPRKVG
jgi:prepilin-type N-terminal cleavage/methylation domain-containing protein